MFVVDREKFQKRLREKGFRSLTELAQSVGIHRNSIHYFLAGRSVFPESFEKVLRVLSITPGEILVEKKGESLPTSPIAPLVDTLHSQFPDVSFILFGSRAEGRAHKYADWDIGAFSNEGLPHDKYLRILHLKEEIEERLPYMVDLVNLNRADHDFLEEASRSWIFLAGRQQDWIELQRRVRS